LFKVIDVGTPESSAAMLITKKTRDSTLAQVTIRSFFYLTWAWIGTGSWQTDRQPDWQNYGSWYVKHYVLWRV